LGIPVTQDGDRYGILDSYILPPVSFSLYETMALLLASRLVLRQTDESNPHVETALNKLSSVLPLGLSERLQESIRAIAKKPSNPEFIHIFEQVAIAWGTQRRLRIRYQSLRSPEIREWYLEPYFVDMTGVGYSTYVIGMASREERKGIVTFKLDRIRAAELLEEGFELPAGLELEKLLGSSWGVIWGEESEVKLGFSPQVTRRVKESVWHPSQRIEDLPDGGCVLTVRVGSTLEMTPWIRSWGPDVEVLAPQGLRDTFKDMANQLCEIYR
jgi:proteasome accessory factor B